MLKLSFRISKGVKIMMSLCRHPYCSVENRNPWSTAALRNTALVDSTGSDFGITPVSPLEILINLIFMEFQSYMCRLHGACGMFKEDGMAVIKHQHNRISHPSLIIN